MRYNLIDYQRAAAVDCLQRLGRGRRDWNEHGARSAFALSAITGSGKTVIATAVIEAMLHGSSDLGIDQDPRAAFLWVTDDPALNRQTRNKMLAASDLLQPGRLVELDNDFLDSTLTAGLVYFLNIQKLGAKAGLAQGGRNLRQFSLWEVLAHTINGGNLDLYLVLDEAHRGMQTKASDRRSIVQRIIGGQSAVNPPVPVVWGISATIARFNTAMGGITSRTTYEPVQVDIERVRASGLLKDEIVLDEPNESGTFSTTLLREAVRATLDFEKRWDDYAKSQDEPGVLPVLVVQVPDKASDSKLTDIVTTIESEWSGLGPSAIVNVFGEHERLHIGTRTIDWVAPESIEHNHGIRVVLAKEAISTGWDCPRAEVLYSERPAKDVTHIAQIIGRMVRQPLARRIATDDTLNTVACFLPAFDRRAIGVVKAELEGSGTTNGETRVGSSVARDARTFEFNPNLPAGVAEVIGTLPTLPAPDVLSKPLSRAVKLAQLLTDTAHGEPMLPNAHKQLTRALMAKLDGLAVQHREHVESNKQNLESVDLRRTRLDVGGGDSAVVARSIQTHDADLVRDAGRIINRIPEGVGKDFLAHRVARAGTTPDLVDIRASTAAVLMVPEVAEEIDDTATKWVRDRLSQFGVAIRNTTGAMRDAFRRVEEMTSTPEEGHIGLRHNTVASTRDTTGSDLPTYPRHLYSDRHGDFPAALGGWEKSVVATELARASTVAWFRNPSRATAAALRIAYRTDSGAWTSVQPDFVVVSRRSDGRLGASIVDPHGDYFADARPKLVALADYADRFGDRFVRVESISQVDDELRVLDLLMPTVQDAIRTFTGTQLAALYASDFATPYQ